MKVFRVAVDSSCLIGLAQIRYGDPLGNKSTNVLISHTHRTGERDNNFIM